MDASLLFDGIILNADPTRKIAHWSHHGWTRFVRHRQVRRWLFPDRKKMSLQHNPLDTLPIRATSQRVFPDLEQVIVDSNPHRGCEPIYRLQSDYGSMGPVYRYPIDKSSFTIPALHSTGTNQPPVQPVASPAPPASFASTSGQPGYFNKSARLDRHAGFCVKYTR